MKVSESEVLTIEKSESELLCTDSTALVITFLIPQKMAKFFSFLKKTLFNVIKLFRSKTFL
jgi:hypothetical protein